MKLLFDDGDEQVNRDSNPDLSLQGVWRGSIESLDTEMLFDPLEKQLDLPAASIELSNGGCRQGKVVGQENVPYVVFGIEEPDAAKFFWVRLSGADALESDDLITEHSDGFIDIKRVKAIESRIAFRARDEEGRGKTDLIETGEIQIAAVHHVEGARFEIQLV